jgi:hypothetical protein
VLWPRRLRRTSKYAYGCVYLIRAFLLVAVSAPLIPDPHHSTLSQSQSLHRYMVMYGQVETLNQIANAWFAISFAEWNWVFLDGVWALSMAFTLPLAITAKTLAKTRPTSSLLGPHTMLSFLGVFAINFIFLIIALVALSNEDWYQCRKW